MARLGNDAALFEEFIGFYREDCPNLLGSLRSAVKERNSEAIHHAAHKLKGLVASLGATDVVASANSLERIGKSRDLADLDPALQKLESDLAAFEKELDAFQHSLKKTR
jgi:two-component system, sensor histidine kinase and response regulator